MIKINIILTEMIEGCNLEILFSLDFKKESWIWINNEIFTDVVMNIIDYDTYDEEVFIQQIKKVDETQFINIIKEKMKAIGWMEVNQFLFEKLEDGFIATEDITTYIFAEKKYFMKKMIKELQRLQWMLKAMAIDSFQHLSPEKKLVGLYQEDFEDNLMILEEILINGEYSKNHCKWKVTPEGNGLGFLKNNKEHRVWSEGNANFIFNELFK